MADAEYKEIAKYLEKARKERDMAVGAYNEVMKNLANHGVKTIEEAEALLKERKKQLDAKRAEYQTKLNEILSQMED